MSYYSIQNIFLRILRTENDTQVTKGISTCVAQLELIQQTMAGMGAIGNHVKTFRTSNIIQSQTVLVKASASQKQPADRHHAVVPKWLICAIFICPLPVTLKIRKNMFWIE